MAVKSLMFSSYSTGPGSCQNALMEAALSKSISHPHIVATYSSDVKAMPVMRRRASRQKEEGERE